MLVGECMALRLLSLTVFAILHRSVFLARKGVSSSHPVRIPVGQVVIKLELYVVQNRNSCRFEFGPSRETLAFIGAGMMLSTVLYTGCATQRLSVQLLLVAFLLLFGTFVTKVNSLFQRNSGANFVAQHGAKIGVFLLVANAMLLHGLPSTAAHGVVNRTTMDGDLAVSKTTALTHACLMNFCIVTGSLWFKPREHWMKDNRSGLIVRGMFIMYLALCTFTIGSTQVVQCVRCDVACRERLSLPAVMTRYGANLSMPVTDGTTPRFASCSVRRSLVMPQVYPGSVYRCGRST